MKIFSIIILSLWLGGTAIMGIFYAVSDRAECINKEGFVKGLLWCESQAKTRIGVSNSHISNLIKGALWPAQAVKYFTSEAPDDIYSCRDLVADIQAGDAAEKRQVLARFKDGIFKQDDSLAIQLMKGYATQYYGHAPSRQELSNFSGQAMAAGINICANNQSLTVQQSVLLGAERFAENR